MVSAFMATHDESGSTDSETTLPLGNQLALDVDVSSMKRIHLKEQFHSGDDQALKVRKPYTITKQRERWTEEEHKKFLEALKLYGRAWRRIEEHVGTKSAVQIRSHAQKFFTKVARESNNGDSASVKLIEIPPPRPKRKPLHPYPRKLTTSTKAAASVLEKPARSVAPDTTEDNQSPTSVLSSICSDAPGATDSNTPDGSLSLVSSVVGGFAGYILSDPRKLSPPEGNISPSSSQVNNSSHQDGMSPMELDLFPEEFSFVEEGSVEVSSTRCLKLFGKTVLVTDSRRPSSPIPGAGKMQEPNASDGKLVQTLDWNFIPTNYSPGDLECSWSALPFGAHAALFYLPLQNGISNASEHHSHFFPLVKVRSPIPVKASSLFGDLKEMQESEILKDGSSSNSNAESQCVEADSGPEAQSCELFLGKEETASPSPSHASISRQRSRSCKGTKGFVPYQRCVSDRAAHARSVVVGEEREEQRIRLCL